MKHREFEVASRFIEMCQESLSPGTYTLLVDHVIPDLKLARRGLEDLTV